MKICLVCRDWRGCGLEQMFHTIRSLLTSGIALWVKRIKIARLGLLPEYVRPQDWHQYLLYNQQLPMELRSLGWLDDEAMGRPIQQRHRHLKAHLDHAWANYQYWSLTEANLEMVYRQEPC